MTCRLCDGETEQFLKFGNVALAGAFLKPNQFEDERLYPLSLEFCLSCAAVQVEQPVPAETLFSQYFYFTSATQSGRSHFAACADNIVDRFRPVKVVEIGCNDGALLTRLADRGVKNVIGIDPASNVIASITDSRVTTMNAYFSDEMGVRGADVVVANNVFAHVPDINGFTAAVKAALAPDGVFVFEVHDLAAMIRGLQYDWIYHEHVYYYSLLTLQQHFARHGMTIVDCEPVALHGGSVRYYARQGRHSPSAAIYGRIVAEIEDGLREIDVFLRFATRVYGHRQELNWVLNKLRSRDARIAGYGASGRAAALIQYCGIDLDYIVDDAPAKHGFCMPGSHIPIVPDEGNSDYLLLLAWTYATEILPKCSGNVIVPLPVINVMKQAAAA